MMTKLVRPFPTTTGLFWWPLLLTLLSSNGGILLQGVQAQTLAQDCSIVSSIWTAMGKTPAIDPNNCCSATLGVTCSSTRVTIINWRGKGLKGSIPTEIGQLTGLLSIQFDNNQLTGVIPSTLGNLVSLTGLQLFNNRLSGTIPDSLGNLASLQTLYLQNNQLSGPIPSFLGSLNQLLYLTLSQNQFSGTIPSELGNLINLTWLYLGNNQLSGTIPTALGNLNGLQKLNLEFNQLTGPIPDSLSTLSRLQWLSLSNNNLTGPIPSSFGNLKYLYNLYLSDNQLSGPIPSTLGNCKGLQYFQIFNNQLNDTIPSSLGGLKSYQTFWVYNNQLSGFPSSLNMSQISSARLFPNPMSSVPYDIVTSASSILLSSETWTTYLNTPVSLKKRQVSSTSGSVSLNDLLKSCNLSDVQSSLVPAGCIAGVYNAYCTNPANPDLLKQCQTAYDQAVGASIFKSLGVCPAWKQGPATSACASAISSFSYNYFVGYDAVNQRNVYLPLNSTHAGQFVSSILASPKFAPCPYAFPLCNWSSAPKP